MITWEKKNKIYQPEGKFSWDKSHAQVPTPFLFSNKIIRIYFSTRDDKNLSRISYIDVNANNPEEILFVHDEPILGVGKEGTFDDSGTMPSWVVKNGKKVYMYYIGWNVRNTIPYYNSVGLAISEDSGNSFKRFSEGPLWDRDYIEPYFSASTCVLFDDGLWKCWYLSCTEFRLIDGKREPRYHLKYAESSDGIKWKREGLVAIDYKNENEAGIVKASVIREGEIYKMWYSYRNFKDYRTDKNNSYKIGYAESFNGINWHRKDDESGISQSATGWDSQMMAYPHVIKYLDKYYLFYNGNGFGKEGFGYAEYTAKN